MTGPSALRIVQTLSLLEVQPAGKALKVPSGQGSPVFALDAAGQVALASTLTGSNVSFTANSTASLLASMALSQAVPGKTPAESKIAIESAADFQALTAAIASAVSAGQNPLDQSAVKDRFASVLQQAGASLMASASGVSGQPQAVASASVPDSGARSQPQAVAPNRVPYSLSPTLRRTYIGRVNLTSLVVPNYRSQVSIQNNSLLAFNISLLDSAGVERTPPTKVEATNLFVAKVGNAIPVPLTRTFLGAFSVKVEPDNNGNVAEALKRALLGISTSDLVGVEACLDAVDDVAKSVKYDATVAFTNLSGQVEDLLSKLGRETPGLLLDCGIPIFFPELLAAYKALLKVSDVVGLGALLAEIEYVGPNAEMIGVCVDESQTLINCVERIEIDHKPAPMQPFASQPISISFKDKFDQRTVPYGIVVLYGGDPDLFTLNDTRTRLEANLKDKEGFGAVTVIDPATDKSLEIKVRVTKGKFDKPNYVVSAGSTVEIRVVDPDTGEDVHRSLAFQPVMAVPTYGRVDSPKDSDIAPLQFVAGSVPTPTPQALRGYVGFADETSLASTIEVVGGSGFWDGTYTYNECIDPGYAGSGDACNYAAFPAGGNASSNTGRLLARLGSTEAGNIRWNYSVGGFSQVELCSASGAGVDLATTDTFARPIDLAATFYNTGASIPANMVFTVTSRTATKISGTFSVAFTYPAFGATIYSPYVPMPGIAKGVWSLSPRGTSFPKCTYPPPAEYCLAGNYAYRQGGSGGEIVGSCDWRPPSAPGRTDEWMVLK